MGVDPRAFKMALTIISNPTLGGRRAPADTLMGGWPGPDQRCRGERVVYMLCLPDMVRLLLPDVVQPVLAQDVVQLVLLQDVV